MKYKRIFLIILDSIGIGQTKDSYKYNSINANTLKKIIENTNPYLPNLNKIGFLDTINLTENDNREAYYTSCSPANEGVDSLTGHLEIIGIKQEKLFDTFPEAFDTQLVQKISQITGRRIMGNLCCSNKDILKQLGQTAHNYGGLIIYTTSDSNLQIAAHEDVVPINTLYEYANRIKNLTINENINISRIIARPFTGTKTYKFINSAKKEIINLEINNNILTSLVENKYQVIGIGKINDIFQGKGISKQIKSSSNSEGVGKLLEIMEKDFTGLCMINLNDFDEIYGHNRDIEGYAKSLEEFDVDIPIILNKLNLDDMIIITSDHGCDPTFPGNGHTRENSPLIIYSRSFKEPKRLSEKKTLADIGATIAENFEIPHPEIGNSLLNELN